MAKDDLEKALESFRVIRGSLREQGVEDLDLGWALGLAGRELEARVNSWPQSPSWKDFEYPGEEVSFQDQDLASFEFSHERLIDENDLLPVSFLEQGVRVQRAVARIVLTQPHKGFPPGTGWATGFLVGSSLFMTNNHAIPDSDFAQKVRVQFNYQLAPDGRDREDDSYVVEDFLHTEPKLDYSLVRLAEKPVQDDSVVGARKMGAGERWGRIPLNPTPLYRKEQHLNIVQHPMGRRKEIAIQDNEISKLFLNVVRYTADTQHASSGSPVFDNLWQLVALHHAGGEQDEEERWVNNQGIRIDRIVEDLRQHFGFGGDSSVLTELGV
ncbi:MAG: serine protease [Acidobacteriota bacterium]